LHVGKNSPFSRAAFAAREDVTVSSPVQPVDADRFSYLPCVPFLRGAPAEN
jgi:hypothetical protein